MIVKNESHIICETLDCISKYIDYYVIIDTGSTDNTKEVITNFFKEKNILGEIHDVPWKNFGYNRSEAIKHCKGKAEYIWVIDADDLIVGDLKLPDKLEERAYNLIYGDNFTYWRTQIFNIKDYDWRYVGVLHEYPACEPENGNIVEIYGDYHMDSRRLGDRNKDSNKYERDCNLLKQGIIDEPDNERYMFYLAQSYMDLNEHGKAEEWYLKRAEKGRWYEEHFYSLYKAGLCKMYQNKPWNESLDCFLEAYKINSCRIEPIYEIVKYYREDNNFAEGYKYGSYFKDINSHDWWYKKHTDQKLFIHNDIYDYKFFDEMSICAYYQGKIYESFKLSCFALKCPYVPDYYRKRLEENKSFCINIHHDIPIQIKSIYERYNYDNVNKISELLNSDKINIDGDVTFTMTTCKRYDLFEKTINSVINTFTNLNRIYKWIIVDDNTCNDDRNKMKEKYPFINFIFKDQCDKGHSKSMNIILNNIETKYWFHMEDDWTFIEKNDYIAECEKIMKCDNTVKQVAITRNYAEEYKNDDINVLGGHYISNNKLSYVVHEYYPSGSEEYTEFLERNKGLTCGYWPHYTLRPSLSLTDDIKTVGYFNNEANHFEMEFSYRYIANGFKTAFMNGIYCLHTGRLTKDRNDKSKHNAYTLNDEEQFVKHDKTHEENFVKENKTDEKFYNEHKTDLDLIVNQTDICLEEVIEFYKNNDKDVISTILYISDKINNDSINQNLTLEIKDNDDKSTEVDNTKLNIEHNNTNDDLSSNGDNLSSNGDNLSSNDDNLSIKSDNVEEIQPETETNKSLSENIPNLNFIDLGDNFKRYAKNSYKNILNVLNQFKNIDSIFIDYGFGTGLSSLYGSNYFNHVYSIDENIKNVYYLMANINENNINNISTFTYQICYNEHYSDITIDKVVNRYDNKDIALNTENVINKTVMEFILENKLFRNKIGLVHIDIGGLEELVLINMQDFYRLFPKTPLWISFYVNKFKNINNLVTISKLLQKNYKNISTIEGVDITDNVVSFIKCNPLSEIIVYN